MKTSKRPIFLLLLPNLQAGGIQRVALNLGKGLQSKGATIHIIAAQIKGDLVKDIPEGIKLIDEPTRNIYQKIFQLIRYIRKNKPTAILTTNPKLSLIAVFSKKVSFTNTRVVISEHNDPILAAAFRKKQGSFTPHPRLKKFVYQQADAIIGISEGVANGLASSAGIARERIQVIHNPIVDERIKQLSKEKAKWPKTKYPRGAKMLAVGRLSDQKDFATLLQSFAILLQRLPAQLLILGEGSQRSQLEQAMRKLNIEDSVSLMGYTKNPYAYMSSADVFISSSLWEGLPTVHVEALACGCQVVSTDCPSGPSEILADGKYGKLVPVKQPEALADAVVQILSDPIPQKLLRERAEFFSIDRSTNKYWKTLKA